MVLLLMAATIDFFGHEHIRQLNGTGCDAVIPDLIFPRSIAFAFACFWLPAHSLL